MSCQSIACLRTFLGSAVCCTVSNARLLPGLQRSAPVKGCHGCAAAKWQQFARAHAFVKREGRVGLDAKHAVTSNALWHVSKVAALRTHGYRCWEPFIRRQADSSFSIPLVWREAGTHQADVHSAGPRFRQPLPISIWDSSANLTASLGEEDRIHIRLTAGTASGTVSKAR